MIDIHAGVMLNPASTRLSVHKDIFTGQSFPRGKNGLKTEKNGMKQDWWLMLYAALFRKKTNFGPADQTGAVLSNYLWVRKN